MTASARLVYRGATIVYDDSAGARYAYRWTYPSDDERRYHTCGSIDEAREEINAFHDEESDAVLVARIKAKDAARGIIHRDDDE